MKKRLSRLLKAFILLLLAGGVYYIFVLKTGIKIPCPINLLTGYLCPACGVTRMLMCILSFDIYEAFWYNKALFLTLPILIYLLFYESVKYIKTGDKNIGKFTKIILWAEIGILLLFGIVRNII